LEEKEVIRVRNLRYSYVEGKEAIKGLSFDVLRGEIFGVIGPDGAGKTTLIKLLCGLLPPADGDIKILGFSPYVERRELSNYIGYLSQPPSIYDDLSIEENIDFFAQIHLVKDYAERKERLLELTGLKPFRSREVGKLSGGMRQKAGLICALIYAPEVLFLDEPTNGVDPASRREFWDILSELQLSGLTVLISTSYLDEAERCSRVALLMEGKMILYGSPRDLRDSVDEKILEIRGEFSLEVSRFIETLDGVNYAQMFGDKLHVSFNPDAISIESILGFVRSCGVKISGFKEVVPSMEDLYFNAIMKGIGRK